MFRNLVPNFLVIISTNYYYNFNYPSEVNSVCPNIEFS